MESPSRGRNTGGLARRAGRPTNRDDSASLAAQMHVRRDRYVERRRMPIELLFLRAAELHETCGKRRIDAPPTSELCVMKRAAQALGLVTLSASLCCVMQCCRGEKPASRSIAVPGPVSLGPPVCRKKHRGGLAGWNDCLKPHTSGAIKLISATPSPYARKVRIALAEKGLPFELSNCLPKFPGTAPLGR
jgi:hypothetical protein